MPAMRRPGKGGGGTSAAAAAAPLPARGAEASDDRATAATPATTSAALPWAGAACALLALALHANCVDATAEFVFDDVVAVQENKDVTGATPLSSLWTHDYWGRPLTSEKSHKSYRPLTVLVFRLLHAPGVPPAALPMRYKALNVGLHAANTFLVHAVGVRAFAAVGLAAPAEVAAAAALLFAAHPVHTEAVASVVGAADVLSAFFALLAALLVARAAAAAKAGAQEAPSPPIATLAGVSVFLALSFLSKETGLTVVPALLVLALRARQTRVAAVLVASFAGLLAARVWVADFDPVVRGFRKLDNPLPYLEPPARALGVASVWVEYARLLFYPATLSCDYSFEAVPLPDPAVTSNWLLYFAAFPAAAAAVAAVGFSRATVVASGSNSRLWFVALVLLLAAGTFVPASHVFFLPGTVVAERLMYLPSVAVCWFVAAALCGTATGAQWRRRGPWRAAVLVCVLLAAAGGVRTVRRNAEWRTLAELFEAAVVATPGSAKTQLNVGIARQMAGRSEEALPHLEAAQRIYPEGCQPSYWIGRCHMDAHRWPEAIEQMRTAVGCKERDHSTHALHALEKMFVAFQKNQPGQAAHHVNLASVYGLQHRDRLAEQTYHEALRVVGAKIEKAAEGGRKKPSAKDAEVLASAHLHLARLYHGGSKKGGGGGGSSEVVAKNEKKAVEHVLQALEDPVHGKDAAALYEQIEAGRRRTEG